MGRVVDFYCDATCETRLLGATTVDREFKALVDLFNQTTGGPRDVYRGAFEGLETNAPASSRSNWKHMDGWQSIIAAHTSTLTLCTELQLDANVSGARNRSILFDRSFCYDNINVLAGV